METNDVIHGFRLVRKRDLPDTNGTLYEFNHEKTGAQLIWHDRKDENKTFTITFKTIPENDTGVFHMLEHSVLNGSEKYPVREPFVELLKGSMQTFLNAFTYPDKTMYPVSSRNPKDFMNLMSVYLDAVFHPAIYQNPNIFYQEGWHYEIRKKEDEPVFKGVVLNEMKGAFSSVDEALINELNRMLFPDNCYQYVSGGDPEHIPDLTYEKFIETHQRFYHPSNARVFLDGEMDIDAVLKFIDEEYFSKYEKEEMNFNIPMQKAVKGQTHTIEYEIGPDEDEKNRTEVCLAKIVSDYQNSEKNLAWSVLNSILVSSNESPLKKKLIESGLVQDVEVDLYDGIQQPWAVVTLRNTVKDKVDEAVALLKKTAEDLVENGLDHEQILASLNQTEFRYREKHEPAGLMYAQASMDSWLYDGDPALYLSSGTLFDSLRKKTEEGYFEDLLKEFLLADDLQEVIAVPSRTRGEERVKKEKERLHQAKVSWGDDIDHYIEINRKLDEWQRTPDTEEQLNTLPKLALSDISKEPYDIPFEETEVNGVPVILHPSEDTGIVYLTFYFSLAGITREHLSSMSLWSGLLGNLPTENRTLEQLQEDIRMNLGDLSFFVDACSPAHVHDACIPLLGVSCSVLKKNLDAAVPLIQDILLHTVYDKDKVLTFLKQENEDFRQSLIANGHSAAMRRVSAHLSAEGVFREYVGGYESGLYEKHLEDHYEEKSDEFLNECAMYADVIFSKDRLTASVTGKENLDVVKQMINGLHDIPANRARMHYPLLTEKKEFIQIPGGVNYSAMGNNLVDEGGTYDAGMQVMSHLLTYDWLWTEVRVKGGAYGTGFSINPNGNMAGYSYRDPDPENAIHAFRGAGDHLKELSENNASLNQMIIGTIAAGEPLLTPSSKVRVSDTRCFRGITFENRKKAREKILSMNTQKLGEWSDLVNRSMKEGYVCIVGNEETEKKLSDEGFKELKKI